MFPTSIHANKRSGPPSSDLPNAALRPFHPSGEPTHLPASHHIFLKRSFKLLITKTYHRCSSLSVSCSKPHRGKASHAHTHTNTLTNTHTLAHTSTHIHTLYMHIAHPLWPLAPECVPWPPPARLGKLSQCLRLRSRTLGTSGHTPKAERSGQGPATHTTVDRSGRDQAGDRQRCARTC